MSNFYKAAVQIQESINSLDKEIISVFLTGGRSAEKLYNEWKFLDDFKKIKNTHFFFGDERLVESSSLDSNYGMALRSLFSKGIPNNCKVFPVKVDLMNLVDSIRNYSLIIPDEIDILILGLGDDGHIASLFPGSSSLFEESEKFLLTESQNHPFKRATISPKVIRSAKKTFILAFGEKKLKVLKDMKDSNITLRDYPALIVNNPVWLS